MKEKVTVIFDIGKTNKKFFLFDQQLQQLHEEFISFSEKEDDDNFPSDNLSEIEAWVIDKYKTVLNNSKYDIVSVNFSSYGASFVHLGKDKKPVTPFYNYSKPFPCEILDEFYQKYGSKEKFSMETASPCLGMLNSGLQLYWIKKQKPELFKQIAHSLHFPQYLSFLISGELTNEYTSIGCHTSLWDYDKKFYHKWVYRESIDKLFPKIVPTNTAFHIKPNNIKVGIGIHDSSSALIPYLQKSEVPFILISTGTWCICLNPFNNEPLTLNNLEEDCLNYMQTNGQLVRASRLFMGNEYNIWTERLAIHFNKDKLFHKKVKYDPQILNQPSNNKEKKYYVWQSINIKSKTNLERTDLSFFKSYEEAYHQLMKELMDLQIQKFYQVVGSSFIKRIYVDGGFSDNELYIKMLSNLLPQFEIIPTKIPLGSAWGAAMIIQDKNL